MIKRQSVLLGILAAVCVLAAGSASAVSLLDLAATTAISAGWTDLKDTILGILSAAWAPMLGICAVMAGPSIVKGMFKKAVGH